MLPAYLTEKTIDPNTTHSNAWELFDYALRSLDMTNQMIRSMILSEGLSGEDNANAVHALLDQQVSVLAGIYFYGPRSSTACCERGDHSRTRGGSS